MLNYLLWVMAVYCLARLFQAPVSNGSVALSPRVRGRLLMVSSGLGMLCILILVVAQYRSQAGLEQALAAGYSNVDEFNRYKQDKGLSEADLSFQVTLARVLQYGAFVLVPVLLTAAFLSWWRNRKSASGEAEPKV